MSDSIEDQFQGLSRKQPSENLDRRMADLFEVQSKTVSKAVGDESARSIDGRIAQQGLNLKWILSCAACALVGLFSGQFLQFPNPFVEDSVSLNSSGKVKDGWVDWNLLEKAGLVREKNSPSDPKNIRIVNNSTWQTEDGSVRQTYLTLTKKKVWVVDQQDRKIFQMELDIPKTVVKEDPGL